jgi:hypothetical protein
LPYPTDDVREVAELAQITVERLDTPGHAFLKAGVGLIDILDRADTISSRSWSLDSLRKLIGS